VVQAAFQVTHMQRSYKGKRYLIIETRDEMKIKFKWGGGSFGMEAAKEVFYYQ
jgi:hypothetical protein